MSCVRPTAPTGLVARSLNSLSTRTSRNASSGSMPSASANVVDRRRQVGADAVRRRKAEDLVPPIELRIREIQLAARRVDLGPEAHGLAADDDGEARGLRLRFGWTAVTNDEADRCGEARQQQP